MKIGLCVVFTNKYFNEVFKLTFWPILWIFPWVLRKLRGEKDMNIILDKVTLIID